MSDETWGIIAVWMLVALLLAVWLIVLPQGM